MILETKDLQSGYDGSVVLSGITLSVDQGEVVGVLGRNGMGKTTLMRTLVGQVPASAGEIHFDGHRINRKKPYEIARLGMAYVPQGREIFAGFTVWENLKMGALGQGRPRPDFAATMLALFPILAERRHQIAGTMSGGQQQQLAIARALVAQPKLLLLDEPSEGVQPSIVNDIADTLAKYARDQGLTVIIVEQNVDMVMRMADRCLFMENGMIAAKHPVADLRGDESLVHRYIAV